jgi:phytoene dehydrogenase-like protein
MAIDGTPEFSAATGAEENLSFLRSSFRFCPSIEYQERAYDDAKYGLPSHDPVLWCQCPTAIDPSLAPAGKHLLAATVFHAPYELRSGTWDDMREPFADRVIATFETYMPGIRKQIIDWKLFTPVDIERRVGSLAGSPTHGSMYLPRLLGLGPQPNVADSTTPIRNLYICGAGAWPGGGVTGAPGHNAAARCLAEVNGGVLRAGVPSAPPPYATPAARVL